MNKLSRYIDLQIFIFVFSSQIGKERINKDLMMMMMINRHLFHTVIFAFK